MKLAAAALKLAQHGVDAFRFGHPVPARDGGVGRGAEEKLTVRIERLIIHLCAPCMDGHAA